VALNNKYFKRKGVSIYIYICICTFFFTILENNFGIKNLCYEVFLFFLLRERVVWNTRKFLAASLGVLPYVLRAELRFRPVNEVMRRMRNYQRDKLCRLGKRCDSLRLLFQPSLLSTNEKIVRDILCVLFLSFFSFNSFTSELNPC